MADDDLIAAVMTAESGGNPYASHRNRNGTLDVGSMQINSSNFDRLGITDPLSSDQSMAAGEKVLDEGLSQFKDTRLAVAAYNAGLGAVNRAIAKAGSTNYDDVAPFLPTTTRNTYIPNVMTAYDNLKSQRVAKAQQQNDPQSSSDPNAPWGTTNDFNLASEDIVNDPRFDKMSATEKVQQFSRLYDSRKWNPQVDGVLKKMTDVIWSNGDATDQPDLSSVLPYIHRIDGNSEDEINKSSVTSKALFFKDLKQHGGNPNIYGNQIDAAFDNYTQNKQDQVATKNRGMFGEAVQAGKQILRGATEGYTNAVAAFPTVAGYEGAGAAIRDFPKNTFGDARELENEVDDQGSIVTDSNGQPVSRYRGTILRGLGQVASLIGGGVAMKAAGYGATAIAGMVGGVNTLASGDSAYAQTKAAGGDRRAALTAFVEALPPAAIASLGDASIVASNAHFISGLTGLNKTRAIAMTMEAAAKGAAANLVTEAGVENAVNQQTGQPFSTKNLTIAAATGGIVGAGLGALEASHYQEPVEPPPPNPADFGIIRSSEALYDAPLGLPAPEPRLGLPAPQPKLEYTGDQLPPPPGPGGPGGPGGPQYRTLTGEEQIKLAQKFEDFQNSKDNKVVLKFGKPESIPPDILDMFGYRAEQLSEKEVALYTNETYAPPEPTGTPELDDSIHTLATDLANSPHPSQYKDLLEERNNINEALDYYDSTGRYRTEAQDIVSQQKQVESDIRKATGSLRRYRDPALQEVVQAELAGLNARRSSLAESLQSLQGNVGSLVGRLDEVNGHLQSLDDPLYLNNQASKERTLQNLLRRRADEYLQQTTEAESQLPLKEAAVKVNTDVGERNILPMNDKWFVLDEKGRPLSTGDERFKDALDLAQRTQHADQFVGAKEEPATTETFPASPPIKLGKAMVIDRSVGPYTEAEVQQARKSFDEALRGTRNLDTTKVPKGTTVKIGKKRVQIEQPNRTIKGNFVADNTNGILSDSSGIQFPDRTKEPVTDFTQADAPKIASDLKLNPKFAGRVKENPEDGIDSSFIPKKQFDETGTEPISPRDVHKQLTKVIRAMGENPDILSEGGKMRKGWLGYFSPSKNFIKVGRVNNISTMVHEAAHALDVRTLKFLGDKGYGSLDQRVTDGLNRQAEVSYPDKSITGDTKLAEGLSTFVENWVNGGAVQKDVKAWWEGPFAQEYPKIYKEMQALRDTVHAYRNQNEESMFAAHKAKPTTMMQRMQTYMSSGKFMNHWVNDAQPLRRMDKDIGTNIADLFDAKRGAARDKAYSSVNDKLIGWNRVIPGHQSLRDIFSPVQSAGSWNHLEDYMIGTRYNENYLRKGLEPGLPEKTIRTRLADIEKNHPEVVTAANKYWDAWGAITSDLATSGGSNSIFFGGMIQNNLAETGTTHGFYVPIGREGKSSGAPKLGTQIVGSSRRTESPLYHIQNQLESLYSVADRSSVMDALRATAADPTIPSGPYVRDVTHDAVAKDLQAELDGKVANMMKGANVESNITEVAPEIDPHTKQFAQAASAVLDPVLSRTNAPDGFVYTAWPQADGSMRFVEMKEDLADVFANKVSPVMQHPIMTMLLRPTKKIMQLTSTTLRPAWIMSKAARDLQQLYRRMDSNNPLDLLSYVVKGAQTSAGDRLGIERLSWLADHAKALGLTSSTQLGAEGLTSSTQYLQGKAQPSKLPIIDWTNVTLSKIADLVSSADQMFRYAAMHEAADRLGITENTKTLTPQEALELALAFKRSTVDFGVQGSSAKTVNAIVPFFAARIAEVAQLGRDIRERPGKTAAVGVAWAAAGAAYALAHKDDRWFNEMQPEELGKAAHIPVEHDGQQKLIKIPLDNWASMWWTMGMGSASAAANKNEVAPGAKDYANALFKINAPASVSFNSYEDFFGSLSGFGGPLVHEIAQELANRDFYFKKPIVGPTLAEQPKDKQVTPYTTEVAKTVGGLINVSPVVIDHILRSAAPVAGDLAHIGEDALGVSRAPGTEAQSAAERVGERVVQNFYRYGTRDNTFDNSTKKFYDLVEQYNAVHSEEGDQEDPTHRVSRLELGKLQKNLSDINTVLYAIGKTRPDEYQQLVDAKRKTLDAAFAIDKGEQAEIPQAPQQEARQIKIDKKKGKNP